MSTPGTAALVQEASALLAVHRHDEAIEVLRSEGPPNDPQLCALLARSYYQRGDSKGDIFTSHYFARRATQLGSDDPSVPVIQAIGAFRKEQYEEAIDSFAKVVTPVSPAATKLLYGLALFKGAQPLEAQQWIRHALTDEPGNAQFQTIAEEVQKVLRSGKPSAEFVPAADNMFASVTETLKAMQALEIDAPYRHNALSKLRGRATAPKDFYWAKQNVPCQAACPAGTDIPGYLSAIYSGEYDKAYRINLWDNVFPGVLGRVCSRPCESACRHGWEGLGESVAICWSKRSSADLKKRAPVVLDKLYGPTGKKVAVIGAGVAGLAAARNLALLGHDVTVFEKHDKPGGMMNQGIPEFRLPREVIDHEIEQVSRVGVEIVCNTEIGKDLPVMTLAQNFDAVIMAAGTLRPNVLALPGKELKGIRHGLDFLLEVNETHRAEGFGKQVMVIGGGFTAMDCARTAWRLGAASTRVMYRRSQSEMLITPGELEELAREGIPMDFLVSPVAYIGDEHGRVQGMRFVRTELGEPDASGRRRPVLIPGSEFEVPCDTVLLATGQFPDAAWIDEKIQRLLVNEEGWLKSGHSSLTDHAKLFVAGDFATGARTLIDAIGHAKECVRRVDRFLTGETRLFDVVEVSDAPQGPGRIREMDAVPVQHIPVVSLQKRKLTTEVETGYTPALAVDESQRCYLCHYKYEIDSDKCIYCEWCIKAKPRPDCIVRVSELLYDDEDRITGFTRAQSTEETKLIHINQQDCIRCNACVDACPVDCISVQKVSLKTVTQDGKALG